jgi:RNA-directed DNA polymerase
MTAARQQGSGEQPDLFDEALKATLRHDGPSLGRSEARAREEPQADTAWQKERALTRGLMERIASSANLNQAYKRVKANRGAPGVDGMTVAELRSWIAQHKDALLTALLDGSYQPQPVRGVEIPKPGGGKRQLGIPTVVDRLVQQAILQVLEPLLDPSFSASSFGFRPGRGAHDALLRAREYVADGHDVVVDLDLEKFFDRVNHDVLMSRLVRRIGDTRLLRMIRRFLAAGMMQYGVSTVRHEGTPQEPAPGLNRGGPLSPLLSNLLLDDLDKELERRGHRFCRGACPRAGRRPDPGADDCNIYVRSPAAGERVMASVTGFLESRLRLRVNREKSAVAPVGERKFLGYRLGAGGTLGIAPKSLQRSKARLRQITKRNRAVSLARMIGEVNAYLTGWVTYFRHARSHSELRGLDGWLRRKLRCVRLKQCKQPKGLRRFLNQHGVSPRQARELASSGRGWWCLANSPQAKIAMNLAWFDTQGLIHLSVRHTALNAQRNRRVRDPYARWCERGGP